MTSVKLINHSSSTADWNYYYSLTQFILHSHSCFFILNIMFGSQSLFMAIFSFRSITNIYHKEETSEHSVFLFSMVCSKAFFGDACLDVLPKVGGAVSPESFPAFNR